MPMNERSIETAERVSYGVGHRGRTATYSCVERCWRQFAYVWRKMRRRCVWCRRVSIPIVLTSLALFSNEHQYLDYKLSHPFQDLTNVLDAVHLRLWSWIVWNHTHWSVTGQLLKTSRRVYPAGPGYSWIISIVVIFYDGSRSRSPVYSTVCL